MTSKQKNLGPLTFGLDIGIASVGWAVLGESRIVDLGVRCFDKAETAKEGESLNLARRMARLLRRRLRRRAWRLTKVARLLKRVGLIADVNLLKQQPAKGEQAARPWQLRVDALDHKLEAEEWARVLYHLCKHRGFHWVSKAEKKAAEGDAKGEGGAVTQALRKTEALKKNYRSAAEMVLGEFVRQATDSGGNPRLDKRGNPIPLNAARNKQGDYSKALSRELLADELKLLFHRQRELGSPHASAELEAAILGNGDRKRGLLWAQKPALSGNDLLKMLGKCTFEKSEHRAPKASFTAERHVWLTRLNNLRIVVDGTTRGLNEAERHIALPLPYQQAGDFTYKQLASALIKERLLPKDGFKFAGLSYPSDRQKEEGKAKNPEDERLVKLPAWQELRKTLESAGLKDAWQKISTDTLNGHPQLLDDIARVLSVYKEDAEVETELRKLSLSDAMIEALSAVSFDKFSNLSLKALYRIVPLMEQGQRYDEAVASIPEYGHHSQLHKAGSGEEKYLPPFYENHRGKEPWNKDKMLFSARLQNDIQGGIPNNPVVLRALNQARKVVNALIHEYGSPHSVHIEMARDLSRPMDERNKVGKLQEEFRERNDKDRADFASRFNIVGKVSGKDFEKFQLYREQQSKCAYSLEPLDIERLFEPGYAEVDHALPFARSFDDSKNNRVLVLARENRNKSDLTPYEYLGGAENSERWRQFEIFVNSNKAYRQAKRNRLLKKDFGEKEAESFRERNLNDTRYICRFFKNYVEQYLQLHTKSKSKRCVVLSGSLTSLLRIRWGFGPKKRKESDRHHALDAVIAAACGHGAVQRSATFVRAENWVHQYSPDKDCMEWVNVETGEVMDSQSFAKMDDVIKLFPKPWKHFRNEVIARQKIDDPTLLREEMERLGTYPADALDALRPLFVSRAPQRRNSGAAHKDTIYAQPERLKEQGGVTQKVALSNLTLKDLDKLIDPHRNEKLYTAIRTRLEQHGGKGDKAFPANNPLRKPDRDGNPTGSIVRTVTMVIDKLSGIPVRGGIAKNDSMLRVDVFTKAGKFHLVPVYVHHAVAKMLPDRAIVAFKDEDEWTLIDDSFQFLFSLFANDFVRVSQKNKTPILGYYSSCHRGTGNINLWAHDRNQQVGKDGMIEGIGVKTALSIEKFNVDVLGNLYPAPPEKRRDLA